MRGRFGLSLAVLCLGASCGGAKSSATDSPATAAGTPATGGAGAATGGAPGWAAAPANPGTGTAGTQPQTGGSAAGPSTAGTGAAGSTGPAPAAGNGADAGAPSTADSGPQADAGAAVDAGPPETGTGRFPAIDDPWQAGPFGVATQNAAGPMRDATVFYPRELGMGGVLHPIVVWDNGNTVMGPSIYQPLLEHLASHGFAVYAAYIASDGGAEITAGLDWMIMENGRSGSPFYQKLDPDKTAAMGHSQGSIATFAIAGDKRLTTTIHLSGGTNPDIAEGHATLVNLHRPSAFICGEPGGDGLLVGDVASEWCAYDFEHATVPVFLAQITGGSHITSPGMTLGACAAWLRWHLAGDSTMKRLFVGADCELCKRPNWVVKQKDLM